jgi:hypothetical protein
MRTDTQRIDKYKAKTVPATVGLKIAAMLPTMKANYAASVPESVDIDSRVRNFLDQEQVAPVYHTFYRNFARRLYWKIIKKYSGATLVSCAQSTKGEWLAKGVDDGVLRKLALDLFGITLT